MRERPVRVARHAEDEHLAVGARALEVGGVEGERATPRRSLGGRQHRERVEAERRRELARTEHRAAERARGGVEPGDVAARRHPPIWNISRSSVERPRSSRWPVGLWRDGAQQDGGHLVAARRRARSAARTSSSSSFSRQRWKRPSAVSRMRLQVPQ